MNHFSYQHRDDVDIRLWKYRRHRRRLNEEKPHRGSELDCDFCLHEMNQLSYLVTLCGWFWLIVALPKQAFVQAAALVQGTFGRSTPAALALPNQAFVQAAANSCRLQLNTVWKLAVVSHSGSPYLLSWIQDSVDQSYCVAHPKLDLQNQAVLENHFFASSSPLILQNQ